MNRSKFSFLAIPLLVLFLFSGASSFAGGHIENGGDGVMIGSQIFSLDLAEYALEQNPFIGDKFVPSAEVNALIGKISGIIGPETRDILARKLERIRTNYRKTLFKGMAQVFQDYRFLFINVPLKILNDRNSVIDDMVTVRIAAHITDEKMIQINRSGFSKMNPANQAALIQHELLYASTNDKTSRMSRQINAYLFDPAKAEDTLALRLTIGFKRLQGERCLEDKKQCEPILEKSLIEYDLMDSFIETYKVPITEGLIDLSGKTNYLLEGPSEISYGREVFQFQGLKFNILIHYAGEYSKLYSDSKEPVSREEKMTISRKVLEMMSDKPQGVLRLQNGVLVGNTEKLKATVQMFLVYVPGKGYSYVSRLKPFVDDAAYPTAYVMGILAAVQFKIVEPEKPAPEPKKPEPKPRNPKNK